MSNIFRSKEVYKKPPKSLHGKDEIIPVRGVYVSGEYRPPYYDENGIRITEISGNKAKVVNYTDKSLDTWDSVLRVIDFDFDTTCPSVMPYTQQSVSSGYDAVLRVLSFDFDTTLPQFLFYTSESVSGGYDYVLRVLDFEFDTTYPTTQFYTKQNTSMTPEPCLRLATIQTQPAVISNYIP